MVQTKQTEIRADFFPSSRFSTTDADADPDTGDAATRADPDAIDSRSPAAPAVPGTPGTATTTPRVGSGGGGEGFGLDTDADADLEADSLTGSAADGEKAAQKKEVDELSPSPKVRTGLHGDGDGDSDSDRHPPSPSKELNAQVGSGKIILVGWDGDADPENPLNWPLRKKWLTTGLLCLMCLCIGLATAAYSPGITQMCEELGAPIELGRLGLSLFNFMFAITPLFLGPLSEFVGSQPVYLICYGCFVLFFLPLALAQNIGTILAGRTLSGIAGAAGTTIIPGTLANIWRTEERGVPVALFTLVAVFGTVASPLYAGYIVENKGWRLVEWIQLAINGGIFLLELIFLRETRGSVVLTRKAKKLRKEHKDDRYRAAAELETPDLKALLHASTTRAAMLLVKEPVVLFFSLWCAYSWALIFAFFSAVDIAFQQYRGWSLGNGGLAYIGPIIGTLLAFGFLFHDNHLYAKAQARNNGIAVPEARLYYGAVGGVVAAAGMWIFTFSGSYTWVHWIVPEIGLVLVLAGISFIFNAVQAYLSDAYGSEYGSSAISAQGFVRNAMAASFPLFTAAMFSNLGFAYAGLLLSLLITVAIPLPFILIKHGAKIRARSRFAADPEGPVLGAQRDIEKARGRPSYQHQQQRRQSSNGEPASGTVTRVPSPEQ